MKFYGLQKLTLLDFPGHTACTVFTGGCNFRCPFCHNAALVTELDASSAVDEEEVFAFLDKRKGLLDGVAVTGGEPLLTDAILPFLERVKAAGFAVKLDTNGCFPARLRTAVEAGLVDYVAVDIKNRPEKYAETVGVAEFDLAPVRETVDYLLSGAVDYEFRTTVVKEFHTVEDIRLCAKWIAGAKRYFLQNFTDSGKLIGENLHAVERDTLEKMAEAARLFVMTTETRGI